MENREQQILSEIKTMMGSIRSQLELLDAKMAELQQCVDPEDFEDNPIELDIEIVEENHEVETLPVTEDLPEDEYVPIYESEEQEPVNELEEHEPVVEAEMPIVHEVENSDEEDEDGDLPGVFDQPMPLYAAAQVSPKVNRPSVAEVMAENHPWRTDMPGTAVKDVRSAISLNDRIIFINNLFNEDPIAFQEVITQVNAMTSLAQVERYLRGTHPEWDFNSELVYRFMMAIRRKVR